MDVDRAEFVRTNFKFEQVLFILFMKINTSSNVERFKDLVEKFEAHMKPYLKENKSLRDGYERFYKKEEKNLEKFMLDDNRDFEKTLVLQDRYMKKKYEGLMWVCYKLKFLPQRELKMKEIK